MDLTENLVYLSKSRQYYHRLLAQEILAGNPRLATDAVERGLVKVGHFERLTDVGNEEGDSCFHEGCNGVLEFENIGFETEHGWIDGCYCSHTNPPCGYCCNLYLVCTECGREIDCRF